MRKRLTPSIIFALTTLSGCGDTLPQANAATLPVAATAPVAAHAATAKPAAQTVLSTTTVVSINKIKVGDCLNDGLNVNSKSTTISSMERLHCGAPHSFEVYHADNLTNAKFPGTKVVNELGDAICIAKFEGFIGKTFYESELTLIALYPTPESWELRNDRRILCLLTTQDGSKREGSSKNAKI